MGRSMGLEKAVADNIFLSTVPVGPERAPAYSLPLASVGPNPEPILTLTLIFQPEDGGSICSETSAILNTSMRCKDRIPELTSARNRRESLKPVKILALASDTTTRHQYWVQHE
jgi:hypothetical protein